MQARGFTIVEALVVVAMAAVLVTLVTPGLNTMMRRNEIATTHNALLTSLHLARSEAIGQYRHVMVCNGTPQDGCDSDNGWEEGWFLVAGPAGITQCRDADGDDACDGNSGEILQRHLSIPETLSLSGNGSLLPSRVRFRPSGFASGYAGTFSLCSNTGPGNGDTGIVISVTGRLRPARPADINC